MLSLMKKLCIVIHLSTYASRIEEERLKVQVEHVDEIVDNDDAQVDHGNDDGNSDNDDFHPHHLFCSNPHDLLQLTVQREIKVLAHVKLKSVILFIML